MSDTTAAATVTKGCTGDGGCDADTAGTADTRNSDTPRATGTATATGCRAIIPSSGKAGPTCTTASRPNRASAKPSIGRKSERGRNTSGNAWNELGLIPSTSGTNGYRIGSCSKSQRAGQHLTTATRGRVITGRISSIDTLAAAAAYQQVLHRSSGGDREVRSARAGETTNLIISRSSYRLPPCCKYEVSTMKGKRLTRDGNIILQL